MTSVPGRVFVTSSSGGNVDGIAFTNGDILVYDGPTDTWSMFFDGSAAGLPAANINGFNIVSSEPTATVIEMTFAGSTNVAGVGPVDDSDIVTFTGTSGPATAGTFTLLFDGSDVGLAAGGEDVDALTTSGAYYVLSTEGSGNIPAAGGGNLTVRDEDLGLFDGTTGQTTAGTFTAFFDGSDVGLTTEVASAWIDPDSGDVYGSTLGNFNTGGLSGDLDDIFVFTGTTGDPTSGTFDLFFDGDQHRFGNEGINGLHVELAPVAPPAATGWAVGIGGGDADTVAAITVDESGNTYTTGSFRGTVDFDPGPGVATLNSGSSTGLYVTKMDTNSGFLWARDIDAASTYSSAIAVDGSGNTYIAGHFKNTVDFDPGPGTTQLTSRGRQDIFILKLDEDGDFIWARSIGNTDVDMSYGITVDEKGNSYTTGRFADKVDFDPGPGVEELKSNGRADVFVVKLAADGRYEWARGMGGLSDSWGRDIAVDESGSTYTTGSFLGTADFDPGNRSTELTSNGLYDGFIVKLDPDGDFAWAHQIGANAYDHAHAVAVDEEGGVYTTGSFGATVDFDPGAGVEELSTGGASNTFLLKLDTEGDFTWVRSVTGAHHNGGHTLAVDQSGGVYTAGYFSGTVDITTGPTTAQLASNGDRDAFVAKLDHDGQIMWARSMGGTGHDTGEGVAVTKDGHTYLTGVFRGTADFDPGPGVLNLTSNGHFDVFVTKLDPSGNLH
ncbi:MAG: SBBP repeat-containing protein [Actinomycetota bacterium]